MTEDTVMATFRGELFCRECGFHDWVEFEIPIFDGVAMSPELSCPDHSPETTTVFWHIEAEIDVPSGEPCND